MAPATLALISMQFAWSTTRKAEMQYALVVVSNLRQAPAAAAGEPERKTSMVEQLQLLQGTDAVWACQKMLAKLKYSRGEFKFDLE